jgi:hypothetical protein
MNVNALLLKSLFASTRSIWSQTIWRRFFTNVYFSESESTSLNLQDFTFALTFRFVFVVRRVKKVDDNFNIWRIAIFLFKIH